jgi:cytochrome c peroxidase
MKSKFHILTLSLIFPSSLWADLTPIEKLGKHIFFDNKISIPSNKLSCSGCHEPTKGWIHPESKINEHQVVANGAKPHTFGTIKPPMNAYATFSPIFSSSPAIGGALWNGRAEGYGAGTGQPVGNGAVSETVTKDALIGHPEYFKYLGPAADQALNPTNADVEQNIKEQLVCNKVKTAKYKKLYEEAFGEKIDCKPQPKGMPAYSTAFKRFAVAISAYEASSEVNQFSSRFDTDQANFTLEEKLGMDLFFGTNNSGINKDKKDAKCHICHSGVKNGKEIFTSFKYANIGVPFNREIPNVGFGEDTGLTQHLTSARPGLFKIPSLRNAAKGASQNFVKAYTHNGYFKSLEEIVHFYNTRDTLPECGSLGFEQATDDEALAEGCWPVAEFQESQSGIIGNLELSDSGPINEEAAIVAFLKTLSDRRVVKKP